MKLVEHQRKINVLKPLAIYVYDDKSKLDKLEGVNVFEGECAGLKHKITRDEWDKLLELEVASTNDYFGIQVVRLVKE